MLSALKRKRYGAYNTCSLFAPPFLLFPLFSTPYTSTPYYGSTTGPIIVNFRECTRAKGIDSLSEDRDVGAAKCSVKHRQVGKQLFHSRRTVRSTIALERTPQEWQIATSIRPAETIRSIQRTTYSIYCTTISEIHLQTKSENLLV